MIEAYCDKCKAKIPVKEINDSEFIAAKSGLEIMCEKCEKGWTKEKNKLEQDYKKEVKEERKKYIDKQTIKQYG